MKVTLKSRLSEAEVVQRLRDAVEPVQPSRMYSFDVDNPSTRFFEGEIKGKEFKVQRIVHFRNRFPSQISGKVEQKPDGTEIHLNFKLDPGVAIFIFATFSGSAVGAVYVLFHWTETFDAVYLTAPIFILVIAA